MAQQVVAGGAVVSGLAGEHVHAPTTNERPRSDRYRSVRRAKTSAAAMPCGRPCSASRERIALAEGAELAGIGGVHRRLELALVGLQRGELGVDVPVTSSTWSGASASHSSSASGRWWAQAVLGEEVRVAGGDDGVAHEEPGGAVVGVQPVALPRVVAEDDLGRSSRMTRATSPTVARSATRSPSTRAEEAHSARLGRGGGNGN